MKTMILFLLVLVGLIAISTHSTAQLVPVAGGTFIAGTTPVTISCFNIDRYEVTFELWTAVKNWALTHGYPDLPSGRNGYDPSGTIFQVTTHPITEMTWCEIVKWCNARSEMDGLIPAYYTENAYDTVYRAGELNIKIDAVKWTANGYRLPTETEWEFAAMGGNKTNNNIYSGSNNLGTVAWYMDNCTSTHPIGEKSPNELGLYDMSGNVWEWCWDWYDFSGAYPTGGTINPRGPSVGQTYRVVRGGSFGVMPYSCEVKDRSTYLPDNIRLVYYGFRCVQGSQAGTAVESEFNIPQTVSLDQNFPNPFNPTTKIEYRITNFGMVKLGIYDMLGREVAMLVNEEKPAGKYSVKWDASKISSGVYFYKLTAREFVQTRRMLLLK